MVGNLGLLEPLMIIDDAGYYETDSEAESPWRLDNPALGAGRLSTPTGHRPPQRAACQCPPDWPPGEGQDPGTVARAMAGARLVSDSDSE